MTSYMTSCSIETADLEHSHDSVLLWHTSINLGMPNPLRRLVTYPYTFLSDQGIKLGRKLLAGVAIRCLDLIKSLHTTKRCHVIAFL